MYLLIRTSLTAAEQPCSSMQSISDVKSCSPNRTDLLQWADALREESPKTAMTEKLKTYGVKPLRLVTQ